MGICGNFWELLKPCARFEGMDFLRDKRVAVDLSFWIIQHDAAVKPAAGRRPVRNPHLRLTFFRTVNLFSRMGAYPVFVVDGEAPRLKSQARIERFCRAAGLDPSEFAVNLPQRDDEQGSEFNRNSFFTKCVQECVELLEVMGMPVVRASGEAEALCAQLNADGDVDFCITADSDAFLFGAKSVIKSMNSNSKEPFECYNLSDIESMLGLKRQHLIAISLLVGNDYDLQGVPGIGIDSAFRLVRQFPGDEILQRLGEMGKKGSSWLTSQTPPKTRLPPHCERCGHPGSKRTHLTSPCLLCEVSKDRECVLKVPGFKCACTACEKARQSKELKKQESWRIRICQKISTLDDFPNEKIMDIYLNCCSDREEAQSLQWREPKMEDLADFMSYYLNWNPSYTRQRVLPMLTTIFLRQAADHPGRESLLCSQYKFHSIQRKKTRFSHPFYVVKWKRLPPSLTSPSVELPGGQPVDFPSSETDESTGISEEEEPPSILLDGGSWFLVTDENVQLVKAAFPGEVSRFLEDKGESKSKMKGMLATGSPRSGEKQLSITEFYRATKTHQIPSSEKRQRPLTVDRGLSKGVRRRLLFD
ncbi:5'-3' exonuclease family protein [Wolffia australiana]